MQAIKNESEMLNITGVKQNLNSLRNTRDRAWTVRSIWGWNRILQMVPGDRADDLIDTFKGCTNQYTDMFTSRKRRRFCNIV